MYKRQVNGKATGTGAFKIIITFNENIDPIKSSCVLNPANWVIKVKNPDRFDTEPVSYTHLDVYKRQIMEWYFKACASLTRP